MRNDSFAAQGARPSSGQIGQDGGFILGCFAKDDGAVIGEHTVTISATEPAGKSKTAWHAPKKYMEPRLSGLKQQITGPRNDLVIEITWDGGQPFVEDDETSVTERYRPEIHKHK